MTRTVISLDKDEKRWLDRKAEEQGVSMAELVRRAVHMMRAEETGAEEFEALLLATRGIGSGKDGLAVQRRLRNEWKRRSF
ncbi:MAG: ribbon-helix-helix protein, CopG family [Deltaproteobacteria bacterium]|nr:ribbon-helix-helix protein, CopG family [Deltaproteobacteria bacterium]